MARLSIGTAAPESVLLDTKGQEVLLSSVWSEGPTLLTFLRHFG